MTKLLIAFIALVGYYVKSPVLPQNAEQILNMTLPGWRLLEYAGIPDSTDIQSKYGFSNVYKCDLNNDRIPDYAVAVCVGRGACLTDYFVVLIGSGVEYSPYLIAAYPASLQLSGRTHFYLCSRGDTVWNHSDYEETTGKPRFEVLRTDALRLVPTDGCCEVVLILENGNFRRITAGD